MGEAYVYRPFRFFLLTNVITWIAFFIVAYFSYQTGGGPGRSLSAAFLLLGMLAPAMTALWMILSSKNRELKTNFLDRLLNLKLIKPWTIPAILLVMPATVVVSVLLSCLFFGQSMDQLSIPQAFFFSAGLVPVPVMLFGAAIVEEIGWKGYGMDSLRSKYTFFVASLVFAALWAFWHFPLFFINGYYNNIILKTDPLFAVNYIVALFPIVIIVNWLWFANNGSIVTGIMFHAAANFQGILAMGQIAKCIQTVVLVIIAIIVIYANREIFFGKLPTRIGEYGKESPIHTRGSSQHTDL
jgi:hypothetical protein